MGTVMCHRAHQADDNPLVDGLKDITAHVNFTAMALAAQDQPLPARPGLERAWRYHAGAFPHQRRFATKNGAATAGWKGGAAKLIMERMRWASCSGAGLVQG